MVGLKPERAAAGLAGGHVGSRGEMWLLDRMFASGRGVSHVSLSGPQWSSPADGNDENSPAVWKLMVGFQFSVCLSLSNANPGFGPGDSSALQNCSP